LPKKTFEAVKEAKGELITQIKDNQGELHREVQEACRELAPLSQFEAPVEKARNRIEQREAAVFQVSEYLVESAEWNDYIACVIQVKRHTERLDTKTNVWKIRKETAYYAASHLHDAQTFASYIREHWWTENKNHYVRDVVLKEDASRIRTNPGIVARLRSFALNILRFNKISNINAALFENAINMDNLKAYQGIF
jgi:predicted transposase YbfD/YdcC